MPKQTLDKGRFVLLPDSLNVEHVRAHHPDDNRGRGRRAVDHGGEERAEHDAQDRVLQERARAKEFAALQ
jgi:hypothetical protein